MTPLPELTDPFVSEKTSIVVWQTKVRPFLGRQKRRMLWWLPPKPAERPRVFDFVEECAAPARKRALLIYLTEAFNSPAGTRVRVNALQSREIARALNRLGYAVDVVHGEDEAFVPSVQYDVCVGMHHAFGRLLPGLQAAGTRTVYYATGAYWQFEIEAEANRCRDLKRRRGVEITLPIRLGPNDWVEAADAVIALGNGFLADQYRARARRLEMIDHVTEATDRPAFELRNFNEIRRNFLCVVGTGLLHKGLDLVLEAFTQEPDLHLWVCGQLHTRDERDFVRAFRRELFHTPNIHPIGFVGAQEFSELSTRCFAAVHPSCSEGMAGAVLDGMARGLVPVVSRESGVDTDDFGVTLTDCSVRTIREQLRALSQQSAASCRAMSERAHAVATSRYTLERYRSNIERILRAVLSPMQSL